MRFWKQVKKDLEGARGEDIQLMAMEAIAAAIVLSITLPALLIILILAFN